MTNITLESSLCLSIVVPVYNVAKYLGRCIDSLLGSEGIEKTEIILVDDGSTDDSGSIADSYTAKYGFITCLHKENGGLSDARNYGLKHAKGRYVFFCDSDDTVIPEGLAKVIKTAEQGNVDVILWDGITIGENDAVTDDSDNYVLVHSGIEPRREISGAEAMTLQIKDHRKFAVTAWLRACRREFLLENELLFEKGLLHEDELWTPNVMLRATSVIYLNEKVYCYRIRDNSIMGSYTKALEEHAKAFVHIMNALGRFYSEYIGDRTNRRIIMACWAESYLWEITRYGIDRFECRRDVPRSRLFCSIKGFKNKIKALMLCILGFRAYAAIYGGFRK